MLRRRPARIALCALLTALSPGCGSIFGLAFDRGVEVKSTPAGAAVWVDGGVHDGTTPTSISVWSGANHVVEAILVNEAGFELKGQTMLTRRVRIGIVFMDIVFTGGIGLLIDWLTGAMYAFDRDAVLLNLGSSEQAAQALRAERDAPPAYDDPPTAVRDDPGTTERDPRTTAPPEDDGPWTMESGDDPVEGPPIADDPPVDLPVVVDPLAKRCEICDQPRGDISPCPHCGMD